MNIIDQIKAEIERQYSQNFNKATEWEGKEDRHNYGVWYEGKVEALRRVLEFLDTLKEQPCEGLEEAAKQYVEKMRFSSIQSFEGAFKAGAEWQSKERPLDTSEDERMREEIKNFLDDICYLKASITPEDLDRDAISRWIAYLNRQSKEKPVWHDVSKEIPTSFGEGVIVLCKNKNKEDGIWLTDFIPCWEGEWKPRDNWETPVKWAYVRDFYPKAEQPVCEGFCDELDEAASIYTDNLLEKNKAEGTKITPLSVYHAFIDGSQWQKEQKPAEHLSVRDEFDLDGNPKQKPSIFPPGLGEVHFNPISSKQILSNQKPVELGEEELIGQTVPDKQPVCEGLEEEMKDYFRHYYNCDYPKQIEDKTCSVMMIHLVECARHFAKWGAEHRGSSEKPNDHKGFPTTDEEMDDFLKNTPPVELPDKYKTPDWLFKQEKSEIPTNLDEASEAYSALDYDCHSETDAFYAMLQRDAFKAGAKWQKEQMKRFVEENIGRVSILFADAVASDAIDHEIRKCDFKNGAEWVIGKVIIKED